MAADITIWTITSSLPSDASVYVYNGTADYDTVTNIGWMLIDSFPSSVDLNNGLSIKVIRDNENITKNISYTITGGTPYRARLIIYNKSNEAKYDDHLYIDNNGVFTINLDLEEQSTPSIGNIPMGELTFNGVQSVTYNGTDYTKLVVDGTSYPPLPVMISFSIAGTSYQAEEGMTWAEWVASSYNTGGYYLSGTNIKNKSSGLFVCSTDESIFITAQEMILEETTYYELGDGHLGGSEN